MNLLLNYLLRNFIIAKRRRTIMFSNYKRFESTDRNVEKYVFTKNDAVAEAVLYKYGSYSKRTVICCSVMSGCPVGCTFCGTGNRFIRNLTTEEIIDQITFILKSKQIKTDTVQRFQIMFMSMGEPMLNWNNVENAIYSLHQKYPNAELLISTIGVNAPGVLSRIIKTSINIDKVGLQFSVHKSNDESRDILIPYKNKMKLHELRDAGIVWWKETGRKIYLNYCVTSDNHNETDFKALMALFSPLIFNFTFSVVCSSDETLREASHRNIDEIKQFQSNFIQHGYNTRIFDPAGQDDIGGGCGQLWYVQQWLNKI